MKAFKPGDVLYVPQDDQIYVVYDVRPYVIWIGYDLDGWFEYAMPTRWFKSAVKLDHLESY